MDLSTEKKVMPKDDREVVTEERLLKELEIEDIIISGCTVNFSS